MRDSVAETRLHPEDLIAPFFVIPGQGREEPVHALPGIARYSVDLLLPQLEGALGNALRGAARKRKRPAGPKRRR
ncbi:hypothetical protein ABTL66_19785, partial [Acinetobacter baumannii]